jgi:hypothetical protein
VSTALKVPPSIVFGNTASQSSVPTVQFPAAVVQPLLHETAVGASHAPVLRSHSNVAEPVSCQTTSFIVIVLPAGIEGRSAVHVCGASVHVSPGTAGQSAAWNIQVEPTFSDHAPSVHKKVALPVTVPTVSETPTVIPEAVKGKLTSAAHVSVPTVHWVGLSAGQSSGGLHIPDIPSKSTGPGGDCPTIDRTPLQQ